jgi:hypothetical protein
MPSFTGDMPPKFPKRQTSVRPTVSRKARAKSVVRAERLVEALLFEMQLGLQNPEYRSGKDWEKLFGSKDSLVANLQKLVATLATLPSDGEKPIESEPVQPMSSAEMTMLKSWIEDSKANPNESSANREEAY